MCLFRRGSIRKCDPKTRRYMAVGNLCLAAGCSLTIFAKGFGEAHPALYGGLRGLFLGLAIVFLFCAGRMARHCDAQACPRPNTDLRQP
ncbi:MAG: hypothetical protein P4K83_09355 [Terracidiphilus sp.]|nr:hypothetical protein [Terracidiphilus sp.]